jgi:hypothetical protein
VGLPTRACSRSGPRRASKGPGNPSDPLTDARKLKHLDPALLSDVEPKGENSRAFGAYFEPAGFSDRARDRRPDRVVRWCYAARSPGDLPGVNLIVDALASSSDTRLAR